MSELAKVAQAMVARGKGILAADESTGTIGKRFQSINVENTEENRRAYRDLLFSAKGVGEHVSGVILYDETLRQKSANGTPFPEMLGKLGILPGIKVDGGTKDMALCPGETITEGLDGLAKRCAEYVKLGANWRRHSLQCLHHCECARPCPLWRDLPGRGTGAHHRTGSADGRRPYDRTL